MSIPKIPREEMKQRFQEALTAVLKDIDETAMDRIWGSGNVSQASITIRFEPYGLVRYNYDIDVTVPEVLYEIGEGYED